MEKQLNQMSEEYNKDKEGFKINNNIKGLEEKKRHLQLIKGSLNLGAGQAVGEVTKMVGGVEATTVITSGTGGKEYIEAIASENKAINNSISKNEEFLKDVYEVKNKEEFLKNQELLNKFPEVKDHKKDIEYLRKEDQALVKTLNSLGVEIKSLSSSEDFSYLRAIDVINEKIASIDAEINQEKSKLEEIANNREIEKKNKKEGVEHNKEEINNFLSEVENIEKELPSGEVVEFYGNEGADYPYYLKVPSINSQLKSLSENLENKKKESIGLSKKYTALENEMYGKADKEHWEGKTINEALIGLKLQKETEKESISKEIDKLRIENEILEKKRSAVNDLIEKYPVVKKVMDKIKLGEIKGSPDEIFVELKQKIKEVLENLEKATE